MSPSYLRIESGKAIAAPVGVDWGEILRFTVSPLELFVRGTCIYLSLFLIFRFVLKRDPGSIGMADIVVVVLIADAGENAMAGEYKSVSDGLVLIGTIVAWNLFLDWMAYRFHWFERFAEPGVVVLVKEGRVLWRNLRSQMLTSENLFSQLRQQGVDDLSQVKQAALEPDGKISLIKHAAPRSD
jgi:uncharacterized membrane protein YcaP (DUF421 family)